MRFTDNRSHSLQQFCAHTRQLFYQLADKSATLLVHLFLGGGVQAVNEVCGCDVWLEMTGSSKPPLALSSVGFAFCSLLCYRFSSSLLFKAIEAIRTVELLRLVLFSLSLGKLLSAFVALHVIFEHACDIFLGLFFFTIATAHYCCFTRSKVLREAL